MKNHVQPVFIDPITDEGFKRLFGYKVNLINFLNIIFSGRKTIVDLTYRGIERIGATEEIIIEIQTSSHSNLKKRMLYYKKSEIKSVIENFTKIIYQQKLIMASAIYSNLIQ